MPPFHTLRITTATGRRHTYPFSYPSDNINRGQPRTTGATEERSPPFLLPDLSHQGGVSLRIQSQLEWKVGLMVQRNQSPLFGVHRETERHKSLRTKYKMPMTGAGECERLKQNDQETAPPLVPSIERFGMVSSFPNRKSPYASVSCAAGQGLCAP